VEKRSAIEVSGEAILLLPGPRNSVPAATHFRSTWIVASLDSLRINGHLERYRKNLRAYHEELFSCIAGEWLPMSVARAHFEACDALELSPREMNAMVRGGRQVRQAWFANLIAAARKARESGPDANWDVLSQLDRMWRRTANGGATAVYRLGEHKAQIDYVGCDLFDIPYYRASTGTVLLFLGSHLRDSVTVEFIGQPTKGEASYLMQWGSAGKDGR
jgi:hypothetical protein